MAKVNSDTEMPMSWVKAGMKTPKLCRKPMLTDNISAAPIRMGKRGRSAVKRFMVCFGCACVHSNHTHPNTLAFARHATGSPALTSAVNLLIRPDEV
jgi:hypothetical protein